MKLGNAELLFRTLILKWGAPLLCAVLLGYQGPPAMAQEVTVIRGGTLIDGTGAPPVPNAVVVVRGERIEAIGQGISAPAGATVIDATGKYILPALWDAHLHYKDWMPELLITNGVTTVWNQSGGAWNMAQGEGIAKGKILGPRMFFRQGNIGGIYMGANNIVDKREDAIREVRALVERGASWIKVYTSVTLDILQAVTAEAHRHGLPVEGHIGIGAKAAARAGIDGLAHSTGIALDVVRPEVLRDIPNWRVIDTGRLRVTPPKIATWNESKLWGPNPDLTEFPLFIEDPRRLMMFGKMDRALAQELIDVLVEEEVFIESCLAYAFRDFHDRAEQYEREDHLLLNDPNLHYIPERMRMNILDYSMHGKLNADELALIEEGYRNYQWFIKTFVNAGGKLVVGVDTSSVYHPSALPGVATQRELELLVDSGLTPTQAIQAATIWPAAILGKDGDLGTLEQGKLADLLILNGNPLDDIKNYKNIDRVMQAGKFQRMGYHYDFKNPIPWPAGDELTFADWGPVSEIPTRIASLAPQAVVEGGGDLVLTLEGHEFISSSVIQFGDTMLETELVDSTQLKATVPADLVRNVGTYPVQVVHRAPGWGKTNTVYLIVKFR